MKRAFTSLCAAALVLAVAASVAAAPAPQKQPAPPTPKKTAAGGSTSNKAPKLSKWQQRVLEQMKVSAPGDEYFGRMKMSYLGINNTFHDDAIRAGEYTTDPRIVSSIEWADEALTAWAKKYPNDPQLARSYFLAFLMYRKVYTQVYQQKAWDYAHIVIRKWPASYFGKSLKKDLGIGYTVHYFATPVPCTVIADVSPAPTGNSKTTPLPSPTPPPSPSPTPSPAPGQPKVAILPVPCIAPSPSPLPQVSGSPSPSASGSPAPGVKIAPSSGASSTPSPAPSSSASPSASPSSHP